MTPWWDLRLPDEEPKWGRGKRRWRRRHENIRRLEADLGIVPWKHSPTFPWDYSSMMY